MKELLFLGLITVAFGLGYWRGYRFGWKRGGGPPARERCRDGMCNAYASKRCDGGRCRSHCNARCECEEALVLAADQLIERALNDAEKKKAP